MKRTNEEKTRNAEETFVRTKIELDLKRKHAYYELGKGLRNLSKFCPIILELADDENEQQALFYGSDRKNSYIKIARGYIEIGNSRICSLYYYNKDFPDDGSLIDSSRLEVVVEIFISICPQIMELVTKKLRDRTRKAKKCLRIIRGFSEELKLIVSS